VSKTPKPSPAGDPRRVPKGGGAGKGPGQVAGKRPPAGFGKSGGNAKKAPGKSKPEPPPDAPKKKTAPA
jgi:hypothetical protein